MVDSGVGGPYDPLMVTTDTSNTRTLAIVLDEPEWQALRQAEPDALAWLHTQIRARLAGTSTGTPPAPSQDDYLTDDDY